MWTGLRPPVAAQHACGARITGGQAWTGPPRAAPVPCARRAGPRRPGSLRGAGALASFARPLLTGTDGNDLVAVLLQGRSPRSCGRASATWPRVDPAADAESRGGGALSTVSAQPPRAWTLGALGTRYRRGSAPYRATAVPQPLAVPEAMSDQDQRHSRSCARTTRPHSPSCSNDGSLVAPAGGPAAGASTAPDRRRCAASRTRTAVGPDSSGRCGRPAPSRAAAVWFWGGRRGGRSAGATAGRTDPSQVAGGRVSAFATAERRRSV